MSLWICILFLSLCVSLASAAAQLAEDQQDVKADQIIAIPSGVVSQAQYSLITDNNHIGDLGPIVVDPAPPTHPPRTSREIPLRRRDHDPDKEDNGGDDVNKEDETSSTATTNPPARTASTTSEPTTGSSFASATKTKEITKTDSPPAEKTDETPVPTEPDDDTPFPIAFDTNRSSNFTNPSCPKFFDSFLANPGFQQCHAISPLLQASNSFFQASRSIVRLTRILDTACSVPFDDCKALMDDIANKLTSGDNCGDDLELQQPIVIMAYNGLRSYAPIHDATCLKNPETDNYCFADALTNRNNTQDPYTYYLAIGMPLAGSTRPTCNKCLQAVMQRYSEAAKFDNQPVSRTYLPAAEQININCGPSFVVPAVAVGSEKGAGVSMRMARDSLNIVGVLCLLLSVGIPLLAGIL
ncbi:hypothetical protein AJ79_02043 [Helicocarpus griseus UAMH5409]|uniref:DUF7729 domain-containing protein n=1 Tax=Helicocarpus griseus UAMH5409 TaxID=1447875 RepID=A0A2B7Y4X1_9EURO|nr:hypothetical protein AJ79_02043 [Helicocarpus griseus UAMH5409]